MDAGSNEGRWLTVTVPAALPAAVAALRAVTSVVHVDLVRVPAGLTVAAAVSRACGHGGPPVVTARSRHHGSDRPSAGPKRSVSP